MNWKTIYVIVISTFLVGPFIISIFAALLFGIPLQQTLPALLANVYPLVSIVGPPAFALYVLYYLLAPASVFKQVRGDYGLIGLVSLVTILHIVAYFEVATLVALVIVQGISVVGFSVFLANQLRSAGGSELVGKKDGETNYGDALDYDQCNKGRDLEVRNDMQNCHE